jgi:multicomponent Na+:H+ antiporter subunit G
VVVTFLSSLLVGAGVTFLAVSAVGLITLPGTYMRAHAVAKSETLGLLLIFGGLLLRPELDAGAGIRLLLVLLLSLIANPTAVHALIRAAIRAGVLPHIISGQDDAEAEIARELGGDPRAAHARAAEGRAATARERERDLPSDPPEGGRR